MLLTVLFKELKEREATYVPKVAEQPKKEASKGKKNVSPIKKRR